MKIKISQTELLKLLKESMMEVIMREGIIPDPFKKTVSYDPDHENYVNTSLSSNPTYTEKVVNGIKVYSIFQRLQSPDGSIGDGNPLSYSFKKEKGWRFNSKGTYDIFYKLIGQIIDKFLREHPGRFNTTIILPSSNSFNKDFSSIVKSKIKHTIIIDDLISKMTIEEVYDCITTLNSPFYMKYGRDKKTFMKALSDFNRYCKNMRSEYYKAHYIKDRDMRKVITQTMKINDARTGAYLEAINDKDILLLDDTITNGNSINEAVNIIKEYFAPKSITVLTVMSPLYNSDGTKLVNL